MCVCVSVCPPSILQQAVRTMNTKHGAISASLFLLCCAVCCCCVLSPCPPSSAYNVAAMVQRRPQSKVLPFVTATEGVSMRVCLCVFVCHPEHNPDDSNPHYSTSSELQKHPWRTQTSQQQRCNKQRTSHRLVYMSYVPCEGKPVFPLFNLRHPRTSIRTLAYCRYLKRMLLGCTHRKSDGKG